MFLRENGLYVYWHYRFHAMHRVNMPQEYNDNKSDNFAHSPRVHAFRPTKSNDEFPSQTKCLEKEHTHLTLYTKRECFQEFMCVFGRLKGSFERRTNRFLAPLFSKCSDFCARNLHLNIKQLKLIETLHDHTISRTSFRFHIYYVR